MRSTFLVLSACGAVSHASECQAADESSLLALRTVVRTQRRNTDKNWLKQLRDVANSLTEGSGATKTADEVQETLAAASEAIAELSPAIRTSIEVAQQQINDASAAVRACHGQAAATRREQLQAQVDQRHAAVESCEADLEAAIAAEEEACTRAEDCLCDEARAHHTDQTALCASVTEVYEVAFCEHRSMCTVFQECHADEMQVYNSLKADVEAQMAVLQQEYIAAEQAGCLTALIMEAMTPPITPIPPAALVACDDVDVSALAINMPELPPQPAACPHGDVICVGEPCGASAVKGNDGNGIVSSGGPDGASNIQFIDLGAGAFESAGEIRSVRYHVARANQAAQKFQIYRPVSGHTYHLVSETEALASTQAGGIVTQELQTPLQFQAGDYIGWVHTGHGTFPFRGGGGRVRWKYGIQGVGSDIDFNTEGYRIYAYEVTYAACGGDAR